MTSRLVALAAALSLLVACGGDDGDDEGVATATSSGPTTTAPAGATTTEIRRPCAVAPGGEFTAALTDFAFAPQCIQLRVGQSLKVTNNGKALHNISVTGKIDVDVKPGAEHTTATLSKDLAPGNYELFCKYHQSGGMKAILQVVT